MALSLARPARIGRQLETGSWCRHADRSVRGSNRQQLNVQCSSLVKQLVLGAAATAALVTVHHVVKRQSEQQQDSLAQQQQQRRGRRRQGGGSSSGTGWLPSLPRPQGTIFGLAWPLKNKDKQLARQVQEIDAQRQHEAQRELAAWDQRWQLRSKSLTDLRALAAQHRIAGRSRMRKQELVAALEAALGMVEPEGAQLGTGAALQQQQQLAQLAQRERR